MFPDAPQPFIDLSTGINPFSYPLPSFPTEDFVRLPDRARIRKLAATAARWYGTDCVDGVVPAPGTQILLPAVAALVSPGRASILTTSYSEHLHAATLAKHRVEQVSKIEDLSGADLAVIVNPNNPDGRIVARNDLRQLAQGLRQRGGILVIDEAFADVAADDVSFAPDIASFENVILLRSFGKFFGLAGIRLGFALTSRALAHRLDTLLGPWAISGPAMTIAERAMSDPGWAKQTIEKLTKSARILDQMLSEIGARAIGGTLLFRLTESSNAQDLFMRLGGAGILVRSFEENPKQLRWGMPGSDLAWQRLRAVLHRCGPEVT